MSPDILQLLNTKDKRLRQSSAHVSPQKYITLAADMLDYVFKHNALGLAAIQVGVPANLVIVKLSDHKTYVMYNLKITDYSSDRVPAVEGCLSIPDELFVVFRAKTIIAEWEDNMGNKEQKRLSDMDARIVQHEFDHTRGIMIDDFGLRLDK